MSQERRSRLTRRKRARKYNGRGEIYAWLRTHYGDVARCRDVEQRPWSVLAIEMIADGVRREDGREPSVKNISRVWERVCRDVAAEMAAAKPGRTPPSRISPDWRPTIVSGSLPGSGASGSRVPAAAASAAPVAQPAAPSSGPVPSWRKIHIDPNLPAHARAVLEGVLQDFDEIEDKRLKL